jgi:hypothetical protein
MSVFGWPRAGETERPGGGGQSRRNIGRNSAPKPRFVRARSCLVLAGGAVSSGKECAGSGCCSGSASLPQIRASSLTRVAHLRSPSDDQLMSTRTQGISGAAAVLSIAAVLGTCGVRGSASQPDAGVRGRVLYGPTCPGQHVGPTCFRPARGTISVTREPTGRLVARVRSSISGHFTVPLAPGRYLLALLTPYTANPGARTRQMIAVRSHRVTSVILNFDSSTR